MREGRGVRGYLAGKSREKGTGRGQVWEEAWKVGDEGKGMSGTEALDGEG